MIFGREQLERSPTYYYYYIIITTHDLEPWAALFSWWGGEAGVKGARLPPGIIRSTLKHNRKRSVRYWGSKINNIINGSWVQCHCVYHLFKLYRDAISFYRCQFFFSIRVVLFLKYLMSTRLHPLHIVYAEWCRLYLEHGVSTRHNLSMSRHTGTYVWTFD